MIDQFTLYLIVVMIGSVLLCLSIAAWTVTTTMRKTNDNGGYEDDNQVYMQSFEVEAYRSHVDRNFNLDLLNENNIR